MHKWKTTNKKLVLINVFQLEFGLVSAFGDELCELSKAVWDYKNREIELLISWSIVCKAAAFKSGNKRCNLCLAEKLSSEQADQRTLLYKRSELISKCRHRTIFKLKNINKY